MPPPVPSVVPPSPPPAVPFAVPPSPPSAVQPSRASRRAAALSAVAGHVQPVQVPRCRGVKAVHEVAALQGRPPGAQGQRQLGGRRVRESDVPAGLARGEQLVVEQRQQVDRGLPAPRRDHRGDVRVDEVAHELVGAGLPAAADVRVGVAVTQAPPFDHLEPASRSRRMATSSRGWRTGATPELGAVTAMVSPSRSGAGNRISAAELTARRPRPARPARPRRARPPRPARDRPPGRSTRGCG